EIERRLMGYDTEWGLGERVRGGVYIRVLHSLLLNRATIPACEIFLTKERVQRDLKWLLVPA
ncbi:hypothetical protein NDU88_004360, partial [Pleurodeles waltl]